MHETQPNLDKLELNIVQQLSLGYNIPYRREAPWDLRSSKLKQAL